jgi:ligand-binding SRPBCC domain-containing protein
MINKALLPETFNLVFVKIQANTYQLRAEQYIQLPREEAFSFFQDPRNLSEITPDWLNFRMLDFDAGEKVFEGAEYDYSIKWLPWLWRTGWRSRIIHYRPPETFTDIQLKGPYRSWEHLHLFEETPEGTRMQDIVTYRLPFGLVGTIAHRALIKSQLEEIFSYRAMRISHWATGNFIRKHRHTTI